MKIKIISLFVVLSLSFINAIYGNELDRENAEQCILHLPSKAAINQNFFEEIHEKSKDRQETFSSILTFFRQNQGSYYLFSFDYPLADEKQAEQFAKVVAIKAQEANRFVPVIEACEFIEPSHLGFTRQIKIKNGPIIQERVLVDQDARKVIFLDRTFAAVNAITYKDGHWYFSGSYLYDANPTEGKIKERVAMFKTTYENMLSFIKNEDVDTLYRQLISF